MMASVEHVKGNCIDRYPSVVLINALDTPSNGFKTEAFWQVGPFSWVWCFMKL